MTASGTRPGERESGDLANKVIEAVIFDMDGLMLDTEHLYRKACRQAAAKLGYDVTERVLSRRTGLATVPARQVMIDEFGPAFPSDAFAARCEQLESEFLECGVMLKRPGLDPLLDFLDSRRVRKTVATSTRRKRAVLQLKTAGLFDRFDAIATGDEVSRGKPAPDLFLLAAQRIGVEPAKCLVLEDAEPGVLAAHRAGMKVFVVPDLQPVSEAAAKVADGIFDSLDAVTARLNES